MFKIKKRCFFCNKVLREDGTCQNPNCPQYVPDTETTEASTNNDAKTAASTKK